MSTREFPAASYDAWKTAGSRNTGPEPDSNREKAEREHEAMVELLASIREWLDGQMEAEFVDGMWRPNTAMRFATEIDELIGEYT